MRSYLPSVRDSRREVVGSGFGWWALSTSRSFLRLLCRFVFTFTRGLGFGVIAAFPFRGTRFVVRVWGERAERGGGRCDDCAASSLSRSRGDGGSDPRAPPQSHSRNPGEDGWCLWTPCVASPGRRDCTSRGVTTHVIGTRPSRPGSTEESFGASPRLAVTPRASWSQNLQNTRESGGPTGHHCALIPHGSGSN